MVIERGVSLGNALQLVIEINHNLAQRHVVIDFHTVSGDVLLLHQLATLAQAQGHDGTDVVGGGNYRSADIRLFDVVYHRGVGHAAGIVYLGHVALLVVDIIGYVRYCRDDVHVEFAVQTLLHNLHVEQAEESATEPEAQGKR